MLDKIPSTIIVQAQEKEAELRKDIRKMQDAYAALQNMKDFDCPTSLHSLNTEDIDRLTNERINRVSSNTDLLPSEKEKRISIFKNLHRAVVKQINVINRILSRWPMMQWACDPNLQTIIPIASIESVVSSMCAHVVPPMAQQHATLINNALTAISKLREFEHTNNISKMRLEVLAKMDTETFSSKWASGEIHRPQIADSTMNREIQNRRQIFEQTYL